MLFFKSEIDDNLRLPIESTSLSITSLQFSAPFFIPEKAFVTIFFISFTISWTIDASFTFCIHSPIFLVADSSNFATVFIALANLLSLYSHFLNATIASPILAVILKISTFVIPNILANILNANLNPPETIVLTISIAANKPANVRFTLSITSALFIKSSEKSCTASIIP